MTQSIEPNKKSDLTAPVVLDWLQSLRMGLLEGFTVTKGASNFQLNISSGKVVINGTTIYDDETRTNSTILDTALTNPAPNNAHAIVYVTYTYADTFPPAPATIGCLVNTGATPASPSLPADSVKIADIFVPAAATDLTGATIVLAPTMPDRGDADGDTLMERLVASNFNTLLSGGGSVTYDSGTDTMSWTEDIVITSQVTTHKERFNSPALTRGAIAAGSLGSVGSNALVFTVFDRSTPLANLTTPNALTAYVIDFNNPADPGLAEFFDPVNRENLVFIASVINDTFIPRKEFAGGIPLPAADSTYFLQNDSGGNHAWARIDDSDVIGGFHIVADAAALDAIPTAFQKVGMLVFQQDTEMMWRITATGAPPTVVEHTGGNRFPRFGVGALGTADSVNFGTLAFSILNPGVDTQVQISTGQFYTQRGESIVIDSAQVVDVNVAGNQIVFWDTSAGQFDFVAANNPASGIEEEDFPIAVVNSDGSTNVTLIENVTRRCVGTSHSKTELTVGELEFGGKGAMFSTLRGAIYHACCFDGNDAIEPLSINVLDDSQIGVATDVINFEDGGFLQAMSGARLTGMTVSGVPTAQSAQRVKLQWSTDAAAFEFGLTSSVKDVTFKNINFEYTGALGTAVYAFKNPQEGFVIENCSVSCTAGPNMDGVFYWDAASNYSLGGRGSTYRPTMLKDVYISDVVDASNPSVFRFDSGAGNVSGTLIAERVTIKNATNGSTYIFFVNKSTHAPEIIARDCVFEDVRLGVFSHFDGVSKTVQYDDAPKTISGGSIKAFTGFVPSIAVQAGYSVKISGVEFESAFKTRGMYSGSGVSSQFTPELTDPVALVASRFGNINKDVELRNPVAIAGSFAVTNDYTLVEEWQGVNDGGVNERIRRYVLGNGGGGSFYAITVNAYYNSSDPTNNWAADNTSNAAMMIRFSSGGCEVLVQTSTGSPWLDSSWQAVSEDFGGASPYSQFQRISVEQALGTGNPPIRDIYKDNIVRAWGTIRVDGANAISLLDGFNFDVGSFSYTPNTLTLDFWNALPDGNFTVVAFLNNRTENIQVSNKGINGFDLDLGSTSTDRYVDVIVMARSL